LDEERKAQKENSLETKQTDFRKMENKQAGNNRNNNRLEYSQTVRHGTYDRRQVNNPRSNYNRRATQRHLGQIYSCRTEGSPPNRRQLNPQESEFLPTGSNCSSDSNLGAVNITGNESQLMENWMLNASVGDRCSKLR